MATYYDNMTRIMATGHRPRYLKGQLSINKKIKAFKIKASRWQLPHCTNSVLGL